MTVTEPETTMKIVQTLKSTYLAAAVEEGDNTTVLRGAVVIDLDQDHEEQAKEYVRGTLTGRVKTVRVKNASVESIEDADDAGPMVELMMKYVPLAEKNARASSILKELNTLIGTVASPRGRGRTSRPKPKRDEDEGDDEEEEEETGRYR